MMDTIIAMVLTALLFVLFGAVKYRGCTGQCGGCTGACGRHNEGEHDVE